MGSGRSGSTFLDAVLGNHPEIEGVGELGYHTRSGWGQALYCACGAPGNACTFWSDVRDEWTKRAGPDCVQEYATLQNMFERFRRWPRLFRERRKQSARFGAYANRTTALFEAIKEVSGRPVIVDSSKNPVRATALAMVPSIDLRLIHLVRAG